MGVFDWLKKKESIDASDPGKKKIVRPASRSYVEDYVVNSELTKGLFHNTYPGMKLAGGLAFAPIAVPVWYMGIPTPEIGDDKKTKEQVTFLLERFRRDFYQIHTQSHREGTVWIWPKWNARVQNIFWEFIPDESVTDIIHDLSTGEIVGVITHEEITVSTGKDKTATVIRERHFSETKIEEIWNSVSGILPDSLKSKTARNPLGILPIPFANNSEGGKARGNSDYSRIIPDLKDYHDIDFARSELLAKFKPKLIQDTLNIDKWLENNGWSDFSEIDMARTDFIGNLSGIEKTAILWPQGAYEAYSATLKQKYQKIVEASGVPEIVWGLKTEGNRASVEESMACLIKYVHDKQNQKNDAYLELFEASLRILNSVKMNKAIPKIKIVWNQLDAVSDEVRSIILSNFSSAVSSLVTSAGATKEQIHALWLGMYPNATPESFKKFEKGLTDMAGFVQFRESTYDSVLDFRQPEEGEEL